MQGTAGFRRLIQCHAGFERIYKHVSPAVDPNISEFDSVIQRCHVSTLVESSKVKDKAGCGNRICCNEPSGKEKQVNNYSEFTLFEGTPNCDGFDTYAVPIWFSGRPAITTIKMILSRMTTAERLLN